jgi:hypothetical protein
MISNTSMSSKTGHFAIDWQPAEAVKKKLLVALKD